MRVSVDRQKHLQAKNDEQGRQHSWLPTDWSIDPPLGRNQARVMALCYGKTGTVESMRESMPAAHVSRRHCFVRIWEVRRLGDKHVSLIVHLVGISSRIERYSPQHPCPHQIKKT